MSRTTANVRRADLERGRRLRVSFGLFRYALYGFLGLGSEVIFYTLVRLGRKVPGLELLFRFDWKVDPRLELDHIWNAAQIAFFGQCSLWMFVVYATAAFGAIEPLYRHFAHWPIWARALLYGIAILAFEAVSGLALKALTGYAIWCYQDAWNILGMTSLYALPIWTATGLLVEAIYRELMDPRVCQAVESKLAEARRSVPVTLSTR